MSSGNLRKKIFRNIILASFIISLMISAFPDFASAATIQYIYDDEGQVTETKYVNSAKIEYAYDTSGNRTTKAITFLITDISATPSPLAFGDVGAPATQTVTISNAGTADLVISTVSISGANASEFIKQTDTCSNTTVAPSGTCQIAIILTPSSLGQKTATLTIPSNDPDMPNLDIPMSGNGIGYMLTANKNGTSTGTVTATGINCGSDCTEEYMSGASITLTAQPDTCSTFAGWSGGGCSGTGTCTITMNADATVTATYNATQVAADFSGLPVSGTAPLTVNFTDSSTCATSWSWNFGDTGTDTLQNPSHTYNPSFSSYTVSLTATNASGSNTMTKTNYITAQCSNLPVKNTRTGLSYNSLQAAYDAAVDGDTIQSHALTFTENLTISKAITFDGGYDCGFASHIGKTILIGNITVSTGTHIVNVDNFDLE